MKVLITDDSLLAGAAIKSYFTRLDHDVVAIAKNGESAKELFLQTEPDLVTVDAIMPGMSGMEFIKFINQNDLENGKTTKILMISSDEITETDKNQMRVDKYLIKPVTMVKIKEALASL